MVNFLNQYGAISLHHSPLPDSSLRLLDADGDDWVTPTDVLLLINHINAQPLGEGEAIAPHVIAVRQLVHWYRCTLSNLTDRRIHWTSSSTSLVASHWESQWRTSTIP